MIIDSIGSLMPTSCRIIIINVSTKQVTTLALMSALRYSELPILLVDLESTDGSWDHFSRIAALEERVSLCSAALTKHGYILDKIFRETRDENLLLIDSDLEIRDSGIVRRMVEATAATNAFGAGAIHGPEWLGKAHNLPEKVALYKERMWIPFTILKVGYVKDALNKGYSFINRWVPNELPSIPWLSRVLALRFFVPVLKRMRADFLYGTRRMYQNERPNLLSCDTGADVFSHLKYDIGAHFVDFGIAQLEAMVHHYHGVTRRKLNPRDHNAVAIDNVMGEVIKRLRQEYGIEF